MSRRDPELLVDIETARMMLEIDDRTMQGLLRADTFVRFAFKDSLFGWQEAITRRSLQPLLDAAAAARKALSER